VPGCRILASTRTLSCHRLPLCARPPCAHRGMRSGRVPNDPTLLVPVACPCPRPPPHPPDSRPDVRTPSPLFGRAVRAKRNRSGPKAPSPCLPPRLSQHVATKVHVLALRAEPPVTRRMRESLALEHRPDLL